MRLTLRTRRVFAAVIVAYMTIALLSIVLVTLLMHSTPPGTWVSEPIAVASIVSNLRFLNRTRRQS